MVKYAADEIILQENNTLSEEYESHENINYEIDKDNIY